MTLARWSSSALVALVIACSAAEQASSGRAEQEGGAGGTLALNVAASTSGSGGSIEPPSGTCDTAGTEEKCFDGEAAKAGVGACVFGKRTCAKQGEFLIWGRCLGSGKPSTELCGDAIDSDCDGNMHNGCSACDGVSPLYNNPFMDGSLRLKNVATAGFDMGPHAHSWICAQDQAAIHLCSDTVIQLAGGKPTVIGGMGLVPFGNVGTVKVKIESKAKDPIWVLLDSTKAIIKIELDVPEADFTLTNYGSNDVWVSGTAGSVKIVVQNNLFVNSPLKCTLASEFNYVNMYVNATLSCGGNFNGGAPPAQLAPPSGCPQ